VLGHRQRRHVEPCGLIQQLVDAAGTIEQRILGVQMKMNEFLISHVWGKRYYNGVRSLRTTISCVALAFFSALPNTPVHAAGLVFPLLLKWAVTFDVGPAFSPAYDASQAFIVLKDDQLIAVSLETGKTQWSVECPTTAAPAAGDTLVFTGGDKYVQAVAQVDGGPRWKTAVEGSVTSLYWNTGWLLATTDKNALLALRASDGTQIWRQDLGTSLQIAPAPDGERLYLTLTNGDLRALVMQTGEPVWTKAMTQPGTGILPVGDRIYLGSKDDTFYCLSANDGKTLWTRKTGADVIGTPAIDAKRVYFVSLDNVLRALDRKTGSVRWTKSLPMRPSTGPLLTGWTLLVAGRVAELRGYSSEFNGVELGDVVLKTADNQETQLAAPPHLTSDTTLILITKGGQMQARVASPAPYGP
jgi:outer membrane protein assembly factor BamB